MSERLVHTKRINHIAPRNSHSGRFLEPSARKFWRKMMKGKIQMKTITNSTYPAFALFAFGCFALLPQAQAVVPAPDGGYPDSTPRKGQNALLHLTTGLPTQQLVGFRSTALPPAASTPVLALERLCSTDGGSKYGHWRCSALAEHHRRPQHGQWSACPS